jgi:phosphoglycolate phosphatase
VALIAFDLDGTLEDSRSDMVAAICRVRDGLGLSVRTTAELRPHVSRGMDHLYRTCFDEHLALGGEAAYEEIRSLYEENYGAHIAIETRLYDGILPVLKDLAQVHVLALVTNKPEALSHLLLTALAIDSFFSIVIGGDTCTESKPNPLPLREAVRRSGHDKAVMIGDSQGDIRCASAAQIPVIWCGWGYAADPGELTPDYVATEPGHLLGLIAQITENG